MSTRYVWDVYKLNAEPGASVQLSGNFVPNAGTDFVKLGIRSYALSGDIKVLEDGKEISTSPYRYLSINKFPDGSHDIIYPGIIEQGDVWTYANRTVRIKSRDGGHQAFYSLRIAEPDDILDLSSFIETVSSSNPSAYPQYGVGPISTKGCKFKGSDNIDPVSVTYSKTDLQQNEPVEVRVTPRTPTYGGTVYYQYAYSIDGGRTWKNIGSRTTDIKVSVTIPEGAAQFQARVIASDGWGFTSTTPVLGQNLEVSQLKAYAAASGINRAGVKMYVTVDGKIREVQKGYAMVGGKVRKLF